jgi:soluble lytic murein transglycosylase-like protein
MKPWWALALVPVLVLSPVTLPADFSDAQAANRRGATAPRYNFPPASRGDRFARNGPDLRTGIKGWKRYGKLIKRVAAEQKIDPYVLGAYVWVESKFDPRQDYSANGKRALGLGSVQATDHRRHSAERLKDPYFNLTITAKEFRSRWKPHDMFGTVMDVWYPAWRRKAASGQRIPVVKTPKVYVQAIANRYYALKEIDRHLR